MGTKQIKQTIRMTTGGTHLLRDRQPIAAKPSVCTKASVDGTVQRQADHVLKVMVVVAGERRSDGFELTVRRWGYEVGAAHDGATALEMARAIPPDVVIVEIDSPRFSRCRLAARLRNELASVDGLIIALTKSADRQCRQQCRDAGIDAVLCLPVDVAVLETLLWIESTRLNRRLPVLAGGPGRRPERLHGPGRVERYGVKRYEVRQPEVTYQQVAFLERIREAAGQTS